MTEYILDENKETIPCENLIEWGTWMEQNNRIVCKTDVGDYHVSTVFLGLDHGFDGQLELFETMIFGEGELDQYQTRCATWKEAEEMHEKAIDLIFEV